MRSRSAPRPAQAMFERLRAAMPEPPTELTYGSPYQLLVAVILSAQATDKSVNLATRPLFQVAGTPAAMVALGEAGLAALHPHDRPVAHEGEERPRGVAHASSSGTAARCRATRAALEALPGVGRKTANVVMNTAFGEPTIAVDTHIFRVANRTGLAPGTERARSRGSPRQGRAGGIPRRTRTTGCSCTGATSARRGSRCARSARSGTSASIATRRRPGSPATSSG